MAQEMTNNQSIIDIDKQFYLPVYNRLPLALKEGKGSCVWDWNGKKYIDLLAGIAVNSIGHAHPKLVKAITRQAKKLIHISNFYANKPQAQLARKLCELSGMDRAFFSNSGVEAVEGAIKIARKYASQKGKTGKIISMEGCFHGRTLATIATGKETGKKGFEPIPAGFDKVPFNDLNALEKATEEDTVAIIIEPIQGEGGIHPTTKDFLQGVRNICDQKDIVLIFDEIQCGMGRTGKMFGFQHFGIEADVITLAKALGGGFPIGAILCKESISNAMSFGSHGSTFGGNPLACAAGNATIEVIEQENLINIAAQKGEWLKNNLERFAQNEPGIKQVRGIGLMIGIELDIPGKPIVERMMEKGVLANVTAEHTIRFVPPLNITNKALNKGVNVFIESYKEIKKENEKN